MSISAGFEIGELSSHHADPDTQQTDRTRRIEDYHEQQTEAIMLDLAVQFTLNGSGFGIADMNGPPAAYYWLVRSILVADSQLWTNSMGAAITQWGKGNIPPGPAGPMPTATLRWPFPSCPNAADFGTNHFNLKHGDRLFCQVTGGNANQALVAVACIEQWSVFSRAEYGAGPEAHS